jgi:hypothetical protein
VSVRQNFLPRKKRRIFYFKWNHCKNHKFELIPVQFWVTEPDPVYPPEHPKSILKSITENEPPVINEPKKTKLTIVK